MTSSASQLAEASCGGHKEVHPRVVVAASGASMARNIRRRQRYRQRRAKCLARRIGAGTPEWQNDQRRSAIIINCVGIRIRERK